MRFVVPCSSFDVFTPYPMHTTHTSGTLIAPYQAQ